jgi:hypothetical protein
MTLKAETTYEYRFRDAYLYYCEHHDCLRVTDDHEDSVLLAGVTKENINDFIECYFEYILDDAPLKEYFKERLSKVKETEEA